MHRFTKLLCLISFLSIFHSQIALCDDTSYNYNYSLGDNSCGDIDDPFISINRKIFMFNGILDHFVLSPVARGYKSIFSQYTRDRVDNFIDNTAAPLTVVSNMIQLKPENTLVSFWKFVINSTLGVAGVYDVATKLNINVVPQTFGSALAHYGVGPGPYVVLPIFGGTNMRDILDAPLLNVQLNPLKQAMHRDFLNTLTAVSLIHKRSETLSFTDYVIKNSPDPYVTIRSALHQHRESLLSYPAGYRCNNKPL